MTQNLITRLSKLDAPDREVDAEIHALFHETIWKFEDGRKVFRDIPYYTASVDAAIALAERVFPGCDITIRSREKMAWIDGHKGQISYGATPAIAAVIALLRAKEASKL